MSQLLRSLLGTGGKSGTPSKPSQRKCWPALEALEDRTVPSAASLHHHHLPVPVHGHHTGAIAHQMATSGTTSTSGTSTSGNSTNVQPVTTTTGSGSNAQGSGSNAQGSGSNAPAQVTTTTNTSTSGTSGTSATGARHAPRHGHRPVSHHHR